MNVRIVSVGAMECMCAQTRPRFILSSRRVLGKWSQRFIGENWNVPLDRNVRILFKLAGNLEFVLSCQDASSYGS